MAAIRLAEPGIARPPRFIGLARRPAGTSGEKMSVSFDDSRERERVKRISVPSAL